MTVGDAMRTFNLSEEDFHEAFPCSHERGMLSYMHIIPVYELAKKESELNLSNYNMAHSDPRTVTERNKEKILEPKEFNVPFTDNKVDKFHPRLFEIVAIASPGDLFLQMQQHYKGHELPVSCYQLQDFKFKYNLSAQTWIDLHNPKCGNLSVSHFLPSIQFDDKGHPLHKQSRRANNMGQFFTAWRLLKTLKRLICALDLSYDLIDAFMAQYEYFIGDPNIEPMKPETFCMMFIDDCIKDNANLYSNGQKCLDFVGMETIRSNCYKSVASSRPSKPATVVQAAAATPSSSAQAKNDGNKRAAPASRAPKNAVKGYCSFYNADDKCRSKTQPGGCVSKNVYYRHRCSFEVSSGEHCGGEHPAFRHKEETSGSSGSKRRR